MQWSSGHWPAPGTTGDFIDNFMTKANSSRNWRIVINATKDVRERVFRENILKLEIQATEERSNKVVETAAYPLINLLSDVGGILGLYMGMSLLSLLELIESLKLILHLVRSRRASNRSEG